MTTDPIDPDIVEVAALASYEGLQHPNWRAPHWGEISETEQAQFLNPARHALEAAAPLIIQDYIERREVPRMLIETDQQQRNLIRMAQATGWDEGKKAGIRQADWEYGTSPTEADCSLCSGFGWDPEDGPCGCSNPITDGDNVHMENAVYAVQMETMCAACSMGRRCPGCRRDAQRWIGAALPHLRKMFAADLMESLLPQINPTKSERFDGMRRGIEYAVKHVLGNLES